MSPLLPELDGLGLVGGGVGVTHAREEIAQHLRVGMGEFHEFEPVGTGGVIRGDRRARASCGKGPMGGLLNFRSLVPGSDYALSCARCARFS